MNDYFSIARSIYVEAPFDFELNEKLNSFGARYLGGPRRVLPIESEQLVRDAFLACLGTDGFRLDQVDLTLYLAPGSVLESSNGYLHLHHWTIAESVYYKARPTEGVDIIAGHLEMDRIRAHDWRLKLIAPENDRGCVVLHNVSRSRAERIVEELRADGIVAACPSIVQGVIASSASASVVE